MKRSFDIVIAGAGVVGLALAALLARAAAGDRLRVTVIDASPPPTPPDVAADIALRVSAVSSGSANILQQAGAWPLARPERVCPYGDMRVWDSADAPDSPAALRFSAADFAVPQLGYIVENDYLQTALLGALRSAGCAVEFGVTIRAVDRSDDGVQVRLSDDRMLAPDLLVGADGVASFVRKQAGIATTGWRYRQTAFVTHLQPAHPHRHTAWQRFLSSGPIALLPLADGRVSVVWSTGHEQARDALALGDDALAELLSSASDYVLGELRPAGTRASFPLQAQHARQYVLPRLALIGDAAHSVHPLAGQGANLGIADAACLARTITTALEGGEVIGDYRVLRRFERERKGDNRTMLLFIDLLNRLFSSRLRGLATLRSTGMRLFNRSGPIRERAVRVALGIDQHSA